jgi:DNA sulfur modification protein DndB
MAKIDGLYVPALRGLFGRWVYYSCLMKAEAIADRVSFAKEVHNNYRLSDMIQREIKKHRGREIADYLKHEEEKFFNSLVIAVYKGDPTWYEVGITKANKGIPLGEIPTDVLDSFGLLHLTGEEKLFALDGQHRLAGIKRAKEEGAELNEEMSVILIAHEETAEGLRRTRNLFTTLNKTAVPVSKGERISLDENDVMAIITRRLVEEFSFFQGERVSYNATNNLHVNDLQSLTTLGNLYDILGILFSKITAKETLKKLTYSRPPNVELNEYYQQACSFFLLLKDNFLELNQYWESDNYSSIVKRNRGNFGGSLVFRPIGLKLIVECVGKMSDTKSVEERIKRLSKLPHEIAAAPYNGILWDSTGKKIISNKQVLARDIMLYLAGEKVNKSELERKYAKALGDEKGTIKLPTPI